jgi:anthranilate/para-aminobenzoate synthase component I
MTIFPTREAFLELSKQGNVIPVYTDLMADFETPVSAYAKLKESGPSYLLESVEGGENLSRYSFIGCRPRKVFVCGPKTTEIRIPGQANQTVATRRPAHADRGRDEGSPIRAPTRPPALHRGRRGFHQLRVRHPDRADRPGRQGR